MYKNIIIGLLLAGLSSLLLMIFLDKDPVDPQNNEDVKYSFFVAGHVYGKPGLDEQIGMHPPFKSSFEFIRSKDIEFGVLAGDSVRTSKQSRYDDLNRDIEELGIPVHVVGGNHELARASSVRAFEKVFEKRYYSWSNKNDLHIVLDSVENNWNIKDEQFVFLKKTLRDNQNANNIFIYVHNLIWWNKEIYQKKLYPNSLYGRDKVSNFWSKIIPKLIDADKPIYLIAGDVGASAEKTAVYYEKIGNLHFIATGMGGGQNDNFIITHVNNNNSVEFELVALNGNDRSRLGKLEDHGFIRLPRN